FELAQALRGQVDAGYMRQSYDDYANISTASKKNLDGFSTKTKVEWFPTELTTVTFNAGRTIEESVATGSEGFVSNTGALAVDHELLRNVLLSGQASYGKDDYAGIDREDKRTGAKASVAYLLNRRVGVFLTYNYLKQKSDGAAASKSFTDNKLSASVALQF
ncbi:MAG: outer membrane beta-barrel protein, partial [Caulobacter sp.]